MWNNVLCQGEIEITVLFTRHGHTAGDRFVCRPALASISQLEALHLANDHNSNQKTGIPKYGLCNELGTCLRVKIGNPHPAKTKNDAGLTVVKKRFLKDVDRGNDSSLPGSVFYPFALFALRAHLGSMPPTPCRARRIWAQAFGEPS